MFPKLQKRQLVSGLFYEQKELLLDWMDYKKKSLLFGFLIHQASQTANKLQFTFLCLEDERCVLPIDNAILRMVTYNLHLTRQQIDELNYRI